jgi:hypothetical protein
LSCCIESDVFVENNVGREEREGRERASQVSSFFFLQAVKFSILARGNSSHLQNLRLPLSHQSLVAPFLGPTTNSYCHRLPLEL